MSKRRYRQARQENLARLIERIGSQAKVADALDVSPSYVSQMLRGHAPIGDQAARHIEEKFGLSHGEMDETEQPEGIGEMEGDYRTEWVSVPSYFAEAEAGRGLVNSQEVEVPGGFVFKRASLAKAGLLGHKLSCIFARGDSMEPTISAGDLMLLEHDVERVTDGAIYAVLWGDELRCKRLFKRPDGALSVRSDNPDKQRYPDETFPAEAEGFSIVARVVWRGGWV